MSLSCIRLRIVAERAYATRSNSAANQVLEIVSGARDLADSNKAVFRKYWGYMGKQRVSTGTGPPEKSVVSSVDPEKLQQWILANKDRSSTSRGFYRRELIYNIGQPQVIARVIEAVKPSKPSSVPVGEDEVFYWCINDAVETGDRTMALDLYLSLIHI